VIVKGWIRKGAIRWMRNDRTGGIRKGAIRWMRNDRTGGIRNGAIEWMRNDRIGGMRKGAIIGKDSPDHNKGYLIYQKGGGARRPLKDLKLI
jgi:hypothetical protein